MTEKELKRLKRLELLEILIAQDEEIEALRGQLHEAKEQLARSNAIIDKVLVRIPASAEAKPSPHLPWEEIQ